MKRFGAWLAVMLASAFGAAGCTADAGADGPDEDVDVSESGIRDGLPTSIDSVGGLFLDGRAFCTGTLVAPRVVLTAAHCDIGSDRVTFGPSAAQSLRVTRTSVHPTQDLMLLQIAAPGFPAARNIPVIAQEAPTAGASYVIAGYGSDGRTSGRLLAGQSTFTGERFALSETEVFDAYLPGVVRELGPWPPGVTPPPPRSTVGCPGDSGGPVMRYERVLGRYRWVLYGVLSRGRSASAAKTSEERCQTTDATLYVRAADNRADIARQVRALSR